MIPEPHRTHLLELMTAVGPAAEGFVLAGAQAMKFLLPQARATRDFDFVLDVVFMRKQQPALAGKLQELGYLPVEGAHRFQFQKSIPGSPEVMRIEFMAPEQYKRPKDFRVDIEDGVHARACTGGSVVIGQSDVYEISGHLPDGTPASARLRVTRPHSLVMMKCLAMDDRYRNVRGSAQFEHDRDEAHVHAADIIAITSAQPDLAAFRSHFESQFADDSDLGDRVRAILDDYFGSDTAPGLLLYEEFLTALISTEVTDRRKVIASELRRAQDLLEGLTSSRPKA
jgi:hypothetical protein